MNLQSQSIQRERSRHDSQSNRADMIENSGRQQNRVLQNQSSPDTNAHVIYPKSQILKAKVNQFEGENSGSISRQMKVLNGNNQTYQIKL